MKTARIETADSRWRGIYRIGGVAALISVLRVLLDIAVPASLPGADGESKMMRKAK